MITPVCFIYFSGVKSLHSEQNLIGLNSIAFDWFDNRIHSKLDVRFCSIAKPNRTIGVRLSSIRYRGCVPRSLSVLF